MFNIVQNCLFQFNMWKKQYKYIVSKTHMGGGLTESKEYKISIKRIIRRRISYHFMQYYFLA